MFYKQLDKTFQLQPSHAAVEEPVSYFSCKQVLKRLILVSFVDIHTNVLPNLLKDINHATSKVLSGIILKLYLAKSSLL